MNADIILSGYDRDTEFLVTLDIVPAHWLAAVSRIAAAPASDPDLLGVYPLTDAQAERIGELAGGDLDLVPGIAESRHRAGRRSRWNAEHTDGTGRDSRFTDAGY